MAKHTVFHIPGRFVHGLPLIDHEVDTKEEADAAVATGAFAHSAAEAKKQAWTTPVATPIEPEPAAPASAEE